MEKENKDKLGKFIVGRHGMEKRIDIEKLIDDNPDIIILDPKTEYEELMKKRDVYGK